MSVPVGGAYPQISAASSETRLGHLTPARPHHRWGPWGGRGAPPHQDLFFFFLAESTWSTPGGRVQEWAGVARRPSLPSSSSSSFGLGGHKLQRKTPVLGRMEKGEKSRGMVTGVFLGYYNSPPESDQQIVSHSKVSLCLMSTPALGLITNAISAVYRKELTQTA